MQQETATPATTTKTTSSVRLPLPVTVGVIVLLGVSLALTVPTQDNWWKTVIMGIVQGLTEFLPISSTGHLLITSELLNYENSMGGTFEIFIQLGTVIAVVAFYLKDLLTQARAFFGAGTTSEETQAARRFWFAILIAFIPAAVIGLTLRDWIKTVLFDSPATIAVALIVGGIIFIVLERLPQRTARTVELGQISFGQALGIGVAQIFALIPGTSRSGSSIVGGLLAGLDRRTATAFSFYLAIPTLGAATLVDLLSSLDQIAPGDWSRLLLGTVVAMIVGWLSIGWLLRYVARNNFVAFGVYRIIAGVVILLLVAQGWI